MEPLKQLEQKFLYSIQQLADFPGSSLVTAQNLKNKGRIRLKQFSRKAIFNSMEILVDMDKNH